MIKTIQILFIFTIQFLIADETETQNIYYLQPGANLISFNVVPENSSVENVFLESSDQISTIISEGEISHHINDGWFGALNEINNENGYWVIANDFSIFSINGMVSPPPLYVLNQGANLISYPFSISGGLNDVLPFYIFDHLTGIVGQNEAAIFHEGQIYGSLTSFEPNKGYWFLMNDILPFTYNIPSQNHSLEILPELNDERIYPYNQSSKQSVFFVNQVFSNGELLNSDFYINVTCNETTVGGKFWNDTMTDIIAMGDDGFSDLTENYCLDNQQISMQIDIENNQIDMHIFGNDNWTNNNFSIISLSDYQLGDINFDNNINVTDIIISIEHIIENNILENNHQLFLLDSNSDNIINITDIVFIVGLIIE